MDRVIVVISGRIKSGKTTLASTIGGRRRHLLRRDLRRIVISTREILREEYLFHPKTDERRELQVRGEQLDQDTRGHWVAHSSGGRAGYRRSNTMLIIDAVRRSEQISALAEVFESPIFHIHLKADEQTREARYKAVAPPDDISFAEASQNRTEQRVDGLSHQAHVRLDTGRWPTRVIAWRARTRLALWRLRLMLQASRRSLAVAVAALAGGVILVIAPAATLAQAQAGWYATVVVLLVGGALFSVIVGLVAAGPAARRNRRRRLRAPRPVVR